MATNIPLAIGDTVYTVSSLETGSNPYRYKVYVAEKQIRKIIITEETVLYFAGKYLELPFVFDNSLSDGRAVTIDDDGTVNGYGKAVYLDKAKAEAARQKAKEDLIAKGKVVL